MLALPSVTTINHLLAQNDWALPRLSRFSGKTVRFHIAPFSFSYAILPDGFITDVNNDTKVDACCVISPSLIPRLALRDEHAHAAILSDGDSALLSEIFYLSRTLRWDAAEDISQFAGDITAERIVQTTHLFKRHLLHSSNVILDSAAEYLSEEFPLLVKPRELDSFVRQVDVLRDDLACLELRIRNLNSL